MRVTRKRRPQYCDADSTITRRGSRLVLRDADRADLLGSRDADPRGSLALLRDADRADLSRITGRGSRRISRASTRRGSRGSLSGHRTRIQADLSRFYETRITRVSLGSRDADPRGSLAVLRDADRADLSRITGRRFRRCLSVDGTRIPADFPRSSRHSVGFRAP